MAWIEANLKQLEGDAAKRVSELHAQGVDVSKHLFESGRCAVAHASLDGAIVDPDIPGDRRRIADDLDVMMALATRYLEVEAGVPYEMELYKSRDRTVPWHALIPNGTLLRLQKGEEVSDLTALGQLQKTRVSIRLWPHEAPQPLKGMVLMAEGYGPGVVGLLAHNDRGTVFLRFLLDLGNGRLHTALEEGGLTEQYNPVNEEEVEHYTRYFHSVIGNSLVELCIDGVDPVPCEVVIPRNIIPQAPEAMVAQALEAYRQHARDSTSSS